MAATIARAIGRDSNREKQVHRLGSVDASGYADTWRTFATCHIRKDGSGYVEVQRDGQTLHNWTFGPETGPTPSGKPNVRWGPDKTERWRR